MYFLNYNPIKETSNTSNNLNINNDLKSKNKLNKDKILDYISFTKIIASFSVVILHTNGLGVYWKFKCQYKKYKQYFVSSLLIESLFNFAVPLFFLCIGATLLNFNEKYNLKIYFIKRLKKVLLPFIFWNIILYYYKVYIIKNKHPIIFNFFNIWKIYYGHKIYNIFGSTHSFILVYALIPLIAYIKQTLKIEIYSYGFIFLFITQLLIPYLIKIYNLNLVWIYKIKVGHIIYIFAGYIIHHYEFKFKSKLKIYLIGIIGFLLFFFGTKVLTIKNNRSIYLHKGYANVPCLIYSCSFFLFIKEYSYIFNKIISKKLINKIGSLTMGPFYLHFPLIEAFNKYYYKINKLSLRYRLFDGIILYCLSIIITIIMSKIPLIKYLVL